MKKQTIALNSITAILRNRWLHAAAGVMPGLALASPAGLDVASGAVTLTNPNANTLQINQSTASAILNWNSFSIGQDEFVIFNQPSSSSVALNRVLGGSASELLGALQANGRVFLINPAGILVGQGAQIDVNSFIAATQNITDADFLAGNANGRYVFSGSSAQGVVNNGTVTAAAGGFVVLLGDTVKNTGLIEATKGTVVLASGSAMTLDITGNGLVSYTVDQAALSDASGVDNLGSILADGGKVVMTADVARNTAKAAVNNAGFISARSIIEGKSGEIILSGTGGDVVNSGTLDVSGTQASPNAGKVRITSDRNINLTDTSRIVANGSGLLGRGGNVRVIADDTLLFTRGATIQGRGGLGGGFVELSGHKALRVRGALDLGRGGHLLLDPDFLIVSDMGETGYEGGTATVSEEFIEGQLKAGTDVSLVARKRITVENLGDNLLDGVATGENATDPYVGSLFMGIGEITVAEYSGYVAQPGLAAGAGFVRGTGDVGYAGIVMDYSDTIRVDGDITIVGGTQYGSLSLGNLIADDDVYIINATDIDVGDITANGGQADITSEYGSLILNDVTVSGTDEGVKARLALYAGAHIGADTLTVQHDSFRADLDARAYAGSIVIDELVVRGNFDGDGSIAEFIPGFTDAAYMAYVTAVAGNGVTIRKAGINTRTFDRNFENGDNSSHGNIYVNIYADTGVDVNLGYAAAGYDFNVSGYGAVDVSVTANSGGNVNLRNVIVRSDKSSFDFSGSSNNGSSFTAYNNSGSEGFASLTVNAGRDVYVAAGYTVSVSGYGGSSKDPAAQLTFTAGEDVRIYGAIAVNAGIGEFNSYSTTTFDGDDDVVVSNFYSDAGFARATLTGTSENNGGQVRIESGGKLTVRGAGGAFANLTATSDDSGIYYGGVFINGAVSVVADLGHLTSADATYDAVVSDEYLLTSSTLDSYFGEAILSIEGLSYADVSIADGASVSASGYGGGLDDGSDAAVHLELETQQGHVLVDGTLNLNGYSATTVSTTTNDANFSRGEQRSGAVVLDINTYGGDIVLSDSSKVTLNAVGEAKAIIGTGIPQPPPVTPIYGDVELNGDFDVVVDAGYSSFTSLSFEGANDNTKYFYFDYSAEGNFDMSVAADDDVRIGGTINVRTIGDAVIHVAADDLTASDEYVVTEIIPGVGDGSDTIVGFYADGIFIDGDIDVVASAGYEFTNGYTDFYGDDGKFGAGYDADNIRTRRNFSEYERSEAMLTLNAGDSSVYITEDASIALTDFGGNEQEKRATVQVLAGDSVTIDGDITLTGNRGTAYSFTQSLDGDYVISNLSQDSNRGGARLTIGGGPDRVTIGEDSAITLNGNGEAEFSIFADSSGAVDMGGDITINSGRGTVHQDFKVTDTNGTTTLADDVVTSRDYSFYDGGTARVTLTGGTINVGRILTVNAQGKVDVAMTANSSADGDALFLEGLTVNIAGTSTINTQSIETDGDTVTTTTTGYSNYAPVTVSLVANSSSGEVGIGEGGLDIEAAGYLDLDVSAGSSNGNIYIQGPARLAASSSTLLFDETVETSATTDGYIGYMGTLDLVTGIYDDGYLARFTTTSNRVTELAVGSTVYADFTTSAGDVIIDSGLTASGGDVWVDIESGSDVEVGGAITITSNGFDYTASATFESETHSYATYVATGPTMRTGYEFYSGSLTRNGGLVSLAIDGDDIDVRGAINVTGVSDASVRLESSSGDVFVGDSEAEVVYDINVVATGGVFMASATYGNLAYSGSLTVRGSAATLDISSDDSGEGATVGDITVRSLSRSTLMLSGSSDGDDFFLGDVQVRAQGGRVINNAPYGFDFPDGLNFELPTYDEHTQARVQVDLDNQVFLNSLLVRGDDVFLTGSSGDVVAENNVGLFAGNDLVVDLDGMVEADNITLQAGLNGDTNDDSDAVDSDVTLFDATLTAMEVLSITASGSIFAGEFESGVTLQGDGVGIAAGETIDASYATFFIGDGTAPFGADTLLDLALEVFAPEAQPDSTSPNAAFSGESVYVTPGNFHMNGYDSNWNDIGQGDHILIRADNLFFEGSGEFGVPLDVTVNFQTHTPNGSIGLEFANGYGEGQEAGNTNQTLNLTVVDHLSRFPDFGGWVLIPFGLIDGPPIEMSPTEEMPPTDTSFVLGSGFNTGDIIVGETQQTIPPVEDGDDPTTAAMPIDLDGFWALSDDNLVCVTSGTATGCAQPTPVNTTGLVTVIQPVILLAKTPTNSEIVIDKPYEEDIEDENDHVVAHEPGDDNDREVQEKTRDDSDNLECT